MAEIAVELAPAPGGAAVTDKNGAFEIQKLQPGSYTLSAKAKPQAADDADSETIVTTYYPDVVDRERAVSIKVDAVDLLGYDIRLQTAPARRVRGVVIGLDGKPARGVGVSLFIPAASGPITIVQGPGQANQRTAAVEHVNTNEDDGSFEFPAVIEGRWIVRASLSSYDAKEHRDTRLDGSAELSVAKGDITDLRLQLAEPFKIEVSSDSGDSPPVLNGGDRANLGVGQIIQFDEILRPVDGAWRGSAKIASRDGTWQWETTGGHFLICLPSHWARPGIISRGQ